MSIGHGRGYYGAEQLDRPQRRPGRRWLTIATIVGLGAAIWFMLPSVGPKSKPDEEPKPPSPLPPSNEELEQLARLRGFSSAKAYEEAVLGSLRELGEAGAKVTLAPHLQHLEPHTGS